MHLLIDVGNSATKLALWPAPGQPLGPRWRLATRQDATGDDWLALLRGLLPPTDLAGVRAALIASVVPPVGRALLAGCRDGLGIAAHLVSLDLDLGLAVRTTNPRETGIDRIVNAVAAAHRARTPCVVIDAGTALKVDAVGPDGAFLGGAIAPGLGPMMAALAGRAAQLYRVELAPPDRAIGTDTVGALRAGVVLGFLAMAEGLTSRVRAELDASAPIIVTGGDAPLLVGRLDLPLVHATDLTLEGLRLIAERLYRGGAPALAAPG